MLEPTLEEFLARTTPQHDATQKAMARHADEHDFPIVGKDAGAVLATLARANGAQRVFEFGSGFGYSASWFLRGMSPGGSIVLTEIHRDELDDAKRFLTEARQDYEITFEHGDALGIAETHAGPFDVVLIDHEKAEYPQALEHVVGKMAPGGVIVADNVLNGPVHHEEILPYFDGDDGLPEDDRARGLVRYLRMAREHPALVTSLLPVSEGLAISAVDPERL